MTDLPKIADRIDPRTQHFEVEKVLEDDAGIFHGEDECQIVRCEDCKVLIEVLPATVGEAEGPPFRSRIG